MEIGFDIEKYLVHSRKVDVSDLDLSSVQHYPLSDSRIRLWSAIFAYAYPTRNSRSPFGVVSV